MGKEKSPAAPQAVTEAEELPRTIVRRVVKEKLSEISSDGGDVMLHKEALIAFSESARIFIHYLSATAHDICNESKRQIINAEDVLNALDEIEFSEFVEPLRESLDEFRKKAAGKRAGTAKAKEVSKKRKADEDTTKENGKDESEENNEDKSDEQANGDDEDEVEEQATGDDEDEVEEQANGDNEDEVEEETNEDNEDGYNEDDVEEQSSGDDEDEVEEQGSED